MVGFRYFRYFSVFGIPTSVSVSVFRNIAISVIFFRLSRSTSEDMKFQTYTLFNFHNHSCARDVFASYKARYVENPRYTRLHSFLLNTALSNILRVRIEWAMSPMCCAGVMSRRHRDISPQITCQPPSHNTICSTSWHDPM